MRRPGLIIGALAVAVLAAPRVPVDAAPSPAPSRTPSPSPTPSLPRVTQTLAPHQSIGGPRLAEMNTVIVDLPAGVPPPPAVADVAWVLADGDTGEILAAKNPHAHLLPASTPTPPIRSPPPSSTPATSRTNLASPLPLCSPRDAR